MEEPFRFRCATCQGVHTGIPDLAFDAPYHYHSMPSDDRSASTLLTADTCVIADRDFFVRGCLEIPRQGRAQPFVWGTWVSLSRANFKRYTELLERVDRRAEGPYSGWFSNRILGYPDTLHLRTQVYFRPYPIRPRIVVEPGEHPLSADQQAGIADDRLRELLEVNGYDHAQ